MSIDPGTVDIFSMAALRAAFHAAPEPALADLVGEHAAELVGPAWLRAVAPAGLRILGMPGWCGKRFEPDSGDGVLRGANRARPGRSAAVVDSIPITARIAPSRLDGRLALVVGYPPDARFPWPRVVDELRPFGADALLGMTVWIRGVPQGVTPFLLRRIGE